MRSAAIVWTGVVALIVLQHVSTFKLVCYFTDWSQYHDGPGRFTPDDIDPDLCTHIIYAFANIRDNQIASKKNDMRTYVSNRRLKAKNPMLKTLLSVGGYSTGSKPFRDVTRSPTTRSDFVLSVVQFLRNNGFDGLDLNWQYPEKKDKKRFANLIQEFFHAFMLDARDNKRKEKLILSVAVSAIRETIDEGYDIEKIKRFADFINFMTYEFHGYWEDGSHNYTGHTSPLHKGRTDNQYELLHNVDSAVQYLKSLGVQDEKIIMGIPTEGQSFTLSSRNTMVGAGASGPGTPGAFTNISGTLAYYEICSFNQDANIEWITEQEVPYSYKGNQWVGYEDMRSVKAKVQYMKNNTLGGIMIWALDLDDFSGSFCNEGKYPLVGAVKKELNGGVDDIDTLLDTMYDESLEPRPPIPNYGDKFTKRKTGISG
ncbi:chitinase-3-like protein 2 isoform X1 [Anolis carolinensis]|uniref:chitinase-3-like protein 2 isoform X1 n=1 Tax=Anolis carolinensis TaxID=28377 RepID=UPI002F2B7D8F